jgi:integrase
MHKTIHPGLTFAEAAERWLDTRSMSAGSARYISPRYAADLQQYVRALNNKFGRVRLKNIGIRRIREYQFERAERCGPNRINQELGTLVQIMRQGDAWSGALERCYEPLKRRYADVRRAMTPEEQQRFLETAASHEEWAFVHQYAMLALGTTASNAEMRGLRVGDIDLDRRLLHIRRDHAKNRYRIRTIPMHEQALWAAARLIERAKTLGATSPEHYLMPFRDSPNHWDLERPMSDSGLRKPWEVIRVAAQLPWLRIHDLRHTAITRMAEAGVPIPVIMAVSGHVSAQMHTHYTSVSMAAKWLAVEATGSTDFRWVADQLPSQVDA